MYRVVELFGNNTNDKATNWKDIVKKQWCPYSDKKCYKIRKSQPEISIGTCTVAIWNQRAINNYLPKSATSK
jgi:hypothetical protein